MIPENITQEDIIQAIEEINQNGIPESRQAYNHFLEYDGEKYPPKYVLSIANKYANGVELLPSEFSAGNQTNAFYNRLGFKIIEMKSTMEYFKKSDFELLRKMAGVKYNKNDEVHVIEKNKLNKVYGKVEYWAKKIQENVFPNGFIDVRKSSINQGQVFERYQWAKIYPNKEAKDIGELAYTVGISIDDDYCVKIDTVNLMGGKRKKYEEYRGDFKTSNIVELFAGNDFESSEWEGLITASCLAVGSQIEYYEELMELLEFSAVNEKLTRDTKTGLPLNQILFGPPGTGKTYKLSNEYFPRFSSKQAVVTKDQYVKSELDKLSWWEVITLAVLELGQSKVADIFNHPYVQYKAEISSSSTVTPTIWGQLQAHTVDECENVKVAKRSSPQFFTKTTDKLWDIVQDDLEQQAPELVELHDKILNFQENNSKEIKRYEFVTFHQSYTYEDFVEGIKPIMNSDGEDVGYEIQAGVFKKLCSKARRDPDNEYAIFIDEINRGNVSQIFGELITLIEDDKREGAKNELSLVLPYSKDVENPFSVPANVHIIGTMNTADRSVEALDTALRRRFSFVEMMPDTNLLVDHEVDGISLQLLLETINKRIALLLDREHQIGHAYFINVKTGDDLYYTFKDKIIPLLQEYFYGDYGKIGLVLGSEFVNKSNGTGVSLANFDYDDVDYFKDKTVFELKDFGVEDIIVKVKSILD